MEAEKGPRRFLDHGALHAGTRGQPYSDVAIVVVIVGKHGEDAPRREERRLARRVLLWTNVRATVERSDTVVFIGYSMPEYDPYAARTFSDICSGKVVEVWDPSRDILPGVVRSVPKQN